MHEAGSTFRGGWFRRAGRSLRAALGPALLFALACGPAARSQSPPESNRTVPAWQPVPSYQQRQYIGPSIPVDDSDPILAERRLLALNIERQKEMVADANKLLKLARDLNEEIAAKNPGTLTAKQLRKVAEIEKLARSVKERMIPGMGQPASFLPPPMIPYPTH
jgi:hypothetical protein